MGSLLLRLHQQKTTSRFRQSWPTGTSHVNYRVQHGHAAPEYSLSRGDMPAVCDGRTLHHRLRIRCIQNDPVKMSRETVSLLEHCLKNCLKWRVKFNICMKEHGCSDSATYHVFSSRDCNPRSVASIQHFLCPFRSLLMEFLL